MIVHGERRRAAPQLGPIPKVWWRCEAGHMTATRAPDTNVAMACRQLVGARTECSRPAHRVEP